MIDYQKLSAHFLLSEDQVKYLTRNTSPYCICGKLKLIKKSTQSKIGVYLYRRCGDAACEPGYGIKRPNHSAKMKELVANGSDSYKNTLMKRGQLFNKDVNSISFIQKKLSNKGIVVDNLSEDEIRKLNSLYESTKTKSRSHKIKTILSRVRIWEPEYINLIKTFVANEITRSWLESLSNAEFDNVFKKIHGLNTIRNWGNVKENRNTWFKRVKVENLNYNTQGKPFVVTKSGLEARYIEYFESNKILWAYESVILETLDKTGFHVPDFIINTPDGLIMLEVKGSFYRQEINAYLSNKVQAAINYCYQNNMRYVLTTASPHQHNFLVKNLIDTKEKYVNS